MRHELGTCQLVGHRHLRLGTRYRRAGRRQAQEHLTGYDWYREKDTPHSHYRRKFSPDFTQELPRKLLPTRAKERQSR